MQTFDSEQPDHFRYAVFISQPDIEEVMSLLTV